MIRINEINKITIELIKKNFNIYNDESINIAFIEGILAMHTELLKEIDEKE